MFASLFPMLRNSASGPTIGLLGWISAGFQSGKLQNVSSYKIWPERSVSGPDALLHNIKNHHPQVTKT